MELRGTGGPSAESRLECLYVQRNHGVAEIRADSKSGGDVGAQTIYPRSPAILPCKAHTMCPSPAITNRGGHGHKSCCNRANANAACWPRAERSLRPLLQCCLQEPVAIPYLLGVAPDRDRRPKDAGNG